MPSVGVATRKIALLARVVNADGQALSPSDVLLVEYSVDSFAHTWLTSRPAATRRSNWRINAADVFLNSLDRDAKWSLDTIGYNFRHAIDLEAVPPICAGDRLQLRYEITTTDGKTSILRFTIGTQHHDRN